jgi:hypothetical protein
MNDKIQDTYFLNAQVALEEANKENKLYIHNVIESTQICYYNGEKLENAPYNCINVPVKDLVEYFSTTKNRVPTNIEIRNSSLKIEEIPALKNYFIQYINAAKQKMNSNIIEISNKIKELKPNFNEKRLRVYISTCRETTTMQYMSLTIAETFKSLGYDVFVTTQEHDIQACTILEGFKNILEFNPHIIFTINHIYSHFFNDNIFNFIWFQDPMPVLVNNAPIVLKNRDYIFSLVKEFDEYLNKKDVSYMRQSFCLNDKVYKKYKNIKREKKIVFIGSSYYRFRESRDLEEKVYLYIEKLFTQGISFSESVIDEISIKFNITRLDLDSRIIPYVVRDMSVRWLCSIDTDYKIELYGWGWDMYEETKEYYKGSLSYGEEISKVYNSATYVFSPHQKYLLQQRVFEGAGSGAIPILYDIKDITDEDNYNEAFIYFRTKSDLKNILNKKEPVKKNLSRLLNENTYSAFVNKMIKIVNENKND